MNLYKIQRSTLSNIELMIDAETARVHGIVEYQELALVYGKRKRMVTVRIDSQLDNKIVLNDNLIKSMLIDINVEYEIVYENQELLIGPVIGLLLGKKDENLCKNLTVFLNYTLLYEHVNGVLFVFSEDQIDFQEEQINGYVFDPNIESSWRKTELPFPGSIYRRVEVSEKTWLNIKNKMGNSFFNHEYFDKWKFWELLSPFKEFNENLPETTNQINLDILNKYIEKYNGVYLKPKGGSRGKGVHYIEKANDQYIVLKNYNVEKKIMTETEIKRFLLVYQHYLLQEPIRLHSFEGRKVDYRVILQKNHTGNWQCTGMIARFGKTNAISSNFKAHGFAKEGIEALMLQFSYDELSAYKKYQEIVEICKKMAQKIEEVSGPYADLGIDVGIDKEGRILVIEMNKRHDHNLPLVINDKKMYYLVKSNPVQYARLMAMKLNKINDILRP